MCVYSTRVLRLEASPPLRPPTPLSLVCFHVRTLPLHVCRETLLLFAFFLFLYICIRHQGLHKSTGSALMWTQESLNYTGNRLARYRESLASWYHTAAQNYRFDFISKAWLLIEVMFSAGWHPLLMHGGSQIHCLGKRKNKLYSVKFTTLILGKLNMSDEIK